MQKYTINQVKRNMVEGLHSLIVGVLKNKPMDDDDKLLFATLDEIRVKLEQRLIDVRDKYSFSFSCSQAFALRIMANDYVFDYTSYIGNKLRMIADDVHQQFSKL